MTITLENKTENKPKTEYKIQVIMNPHLWDNAEEPYFWCILGWGNKGIDEEWLTVLLEKLPCCSLLMEKEDAELFKKHCDILGYRYTFTHFDGYLKTA